MTFGAKRVDAELSIPVTTGIPSSAWYVALKEAYLVPLAPPSPAAAHRRRAPDRAKNLAWRSAVLSLQSGFVGLLTLGVFVV